MSANSLTHSLVNSTGGKAKRPKAARIKAAKPIKVTREQESIVRPRRGRPYQLRSVVGHVTLTRTDVTAWYVLAPQSVSFRPDTDVETLIADAGSAMAELVGKRVYMRVTSRPVSVDEISDRTWVDAVEASAGPLPGAIDMLRRDQERLLQADLSEKFVFLGVRVASKRRYPSDPRREVAGLRSQFDSVGQILASPSLSGRPASPSEMDLLLRRSVAVGLPLPARGSHVVGDWTTDDLPALTSDVLITTEPWAKTSEVSSWDERGEPQSARVAVLTMGRIGDMDIPQDGQGGWIHRMDRLPFPVEVMATIDVLSDDHVAGRVRHQIDIITDQFKHYTVEHGKPAPRSLARQNDLALTVEDELSAGLGGLATRTDGWYRMAVWGATEEEVRDKVAVVSTLYGRQVEWWWSSGQYDLVREFMPGEPLANSAQRRCLTTPSVMAALPAATAQIGDGYGALVGTTSGTSQKAFMWNLHTDMEQRNRSGLRIVTGGLGSGKTWLMGSLVYETAMMGTRWTVFDPSGRLGKLCALPELEQWSQHINLLSGRDGELSPYRVLHDPRPEHFRDPRKSDFENRAEWDEEMSRAAAQRKALCQDTLTALLPRDLRHNVPAMMVLRAAVAAVPGLRSASPQLVLDELHRIARGEAVADLEWTHDHRIAASAIHTELTTFAATPKGRLIFGQGELGTGVDTPDGRHCVLTAYSLHGLTMPTARQLETGDESSSARQSKALFNLGAWLTQQSIYMGDPNERKGLLIDEGHILAEFEEGAALIDKSSVDSRKHNVCFLLGSQNVNHFDVDRIAPLASTIIIGRTTDPNAAKDALKLAGLPETPAYIKALGGLTQVPARINPDDPPPKVRHEFVVSTKDLGQVEKVTVWGDQHPQVAAALDTTPGRTVIVPERDMEAEHEPV